MSVPITPGTGVTSVAADVVSNLNYQQIKVVDATIGSTNAWKVNSDGSAQVSVVGTITANITGSPSISGAVTVVNTASIAGAVQIAGASPSSIATVQRLDIQVTGSTLGLAAHAVLHGLTAAGGGGYVDVKVDPSGALVTTAASVVSFQGGVSSTSIFSSIPSSVLVGASIFGALPAGNAVIGAVAASISGTVSASIIGLTPVAVSGLQGSSVSGRVDIGSVLGAVTPYAQPGTYVAGAPSVITSTSSVLVLAAPTSPNRNYVTHILVTNNAASSTTVSIVEPGGAVIYSGFAAASGGGWSASFPVPLKQPTSTLALHAIASSQASVLVSMSGFTAP